MIPKKGNVFPSQDQYARAIAQALKAELGTTHQASKILMRWTHASEKTAKNWLSGCSGPRGEHLVAIIQHSDRALDALLVMAGRRPITVFYAVTSVKGHLRQIASVIETCLTEIESLQTESDRGDPFEPVT